MTRGLCSLSLLMFVALSGGPVRAAPSSSEQTAAEPDPRDVMQRFDEAERRFGAGDFAGAIALLEVLVNEHPDVVLQYNLARAYEADKRLPPAIDAYETYLRAAPNAADREDIATRIVELRRELREAEAANAAQAEGFGGTESGSDPEPGIDPVAPARTVEVDPTARPLAGRVLPWAVMGTGALALVAGSVVGARSKTRYADAVASTIQLDAARAVDDARSLALGANIAFAVGGTLVASGLVWGVASLVRARRRVARPHVRLRLVPGPGLVGVWSWGRVAYAHVGS